jgi:lysophospholipase L1-like esterase
MKIVILLLFGIYSILLVSCSLPTPSIGPPPILVAIGDSITMGIQDAGLLNDFQYKSYPYLVAQQMGAQNIFQQAYVATPGIGVPPYETPLTLSNGQINYNYLDPAIMSDPNKLVQLILPKLQNLYYRQPYNNLGVNGAKLYDLRYTTGYSNSADANFFFDIVLRNVSIGPFVPNFGGKTVVQEAAMLYPDYILLWIGNNDVLGYVLGGGEDPTRITGTTNFEDEYRRVLQDLTASTKADIVLANIPEYLPFGFALDSVFVGEGANRKAMLFNPKTLQPIDFDPPNGDCEPLDIEADDGLVTHLLLTAAAAYIEKGQGIPTGLTQDQKDALTLLGLTVPTAPLPLTKDMVLTETEEQAALAAITAFNQKIAALAGEFSLHVVDVNSWMKPGGSLPDSYFKFALVAQDDTMFSLDGVHPNNFGHALCANASIEVLNQSYNLNLAQLNPNLYKGQYSGISIQSGSLKAIKRVMEMYAPRKP